SIKVGTGLIFGQKTEEPTHLTGQFYAGHTGAELGVSLGSTIFFDTADALNFKGFVTTVGIGIGLPVEVSVVRGSELVASDQDRTGYLAPGGTLGGAMRTGRLAAVRVEPTSACEVPQSGGGSRRRRPAHVARRA